MDDIQLALKEHIKKDETMFQHISEALDKIKDNHLAHIQMSISSLEANVGWLKWGIMMLIAGIVATYFKR